MQILFTVTNDLTYDQRMTRICKSLSDAGYKVYLIGVKRKKSIPVIEKGYGQKRIPVFFESKLWFYIEYNIRLFFFLLFKKADIICCIDLDTMLPVYFTSIIRKKIKVYDAHEYFSQQKEILRRPTIYKVWHFIESHFVPQFKNGYTVCGSIASEFLKLYNVDYSIIMNAPLLKPLPQQVGQQERIIIYQGAVNEARGFEFLIPAMKVINATLVIYGDGNFMNEVKALIEENKVQDKVILKGMVPPDELNKKTSDAYIGVSLVEHFGLNQYYTLGNKFFDYMHHAIPQVTANIPEYKKINDEFEIALLINDLSIHSVLKSINQLLDDEKLHFRLQQNCLKAREVYNWQNEEKKLISFYNQFDKKTK
ncbi:MAG TPA: glycosyltransferase [Hanamia sp.]|nr:glycosyltransferase [Hanamia sp.]